MPTLQAFRWSIEAQGWYFDVHWEWHEVEKRKSSYIKSNFTKLMNNDFEFDMWLLNELWTTYYWYLMFLVKRMKYWSEIEFEELERLWLHKQSIYYLRRRLKELWLVKKWRRKWYLHYLIAYKWETIDNDVIDLFRDVVLWPN